MPIDSQTTVAKAFARWSALTGGDLPTFLQVLNDAQTSLNESGMWKSSFQKLTMAVDQIGNGSDGYLTLPRRYASAVGSNYWCVAMPIFSRWHQWSENGPGLLRPDGCGDGTLVDCDDGWPTQKIIPVTATNPTLQVITTNPADAGKVVRFYGLSDLSTKLRIFDATGEGFNIVAGYPNSVGSTQVVKQLDKILLETEMIGDWGVAYIADGLTVQIGWFEPSDLTPSFHRYLTGLINRPNQPGLVWDGCNCQGQGVPRAIELLCRYRTVTLEKLTDWVVPGNLQALGAAIRAVMHESALNDTKAADQWTRAYQILNNETRTIRGGARPQVQIEGWGWRSRLPNAI